jgi:hypothetical protein
MRLIMRVESSHGGVDLTVKYSPTGVAALGEFVLLEAVKMPCDPGDPPEYLLRQAYRMTGLELARRRLAADVE